MQACFFARKAGGGGQTLLIYPALKKVGGQLTRLTRRLRSLWMYAVRKQDSEITFSKR